MFRPLSHSQKIPGQFYPFMKSRWKSSGRFEVPNKFIENRVTLTIEKMEEEAQQKSNKHMILWVTNIEKIETRSQLASGND